MKLHRNEKYFKWGLTAFLVIVAGVLFWIVFSNLPGFYNMILDFFDIIAPILYGCLFAYLMNPIMKRAQALLEKLLAKTKLTEKKQLLLAKTGGLIVSLLVLLLAIYALIALIVPNIISSLEELLQQSKLEGYYARITEWVNEIFAGTRFEQWFHDNLDSLLKLIMDWLKNIDLPKLLSGLTSSVYSVVMSVFNMLVGIVAAVYLLLYEKKLCAQAKKITVAVFNTKHADRLFEIARRTNRIFSGYVIGKIIDAILVGVITYFALLIMRMPYAPLIAVLVGVTNIIPIDALYFIIFILVLQMIDGNIIENRILGEKLGISDLWVLVAILVFGGIFGFGGMLLGVPIFAVIYTLITDGVNERLRRKRYPTETDLYYTLQCVEELPVSPQPSYSFVSVDPAYDMHAQDEDDDDMEE